MHNRSNHIIFTFFAFFFFLIKLSAQDVNNAFNIKGKVEDVTNNQPLPFTSVSILKNINGNDSQIGGVSSDENGNFNFTNITSGEIKIRISFVGYKNFEKLINLNTDLNLGTIQLQPEANILKEVNIIGQKNTTSMSLDKRVYNVTSNLTTVGGTAENLLRNVPSLTIDADGTAKLRNATTTIYINGKPTQLTLAQIPANQIESVEVLSNPSAKYDASASSGIVNLILKKNREAGYNGNVSVGIGNNNRYDGSINIDINQGKWSFTGLYNINSTKNPLTNFVNRTNYDSSGVPTNHYHQFTDINLNNIFQNGRISAEYAFNPKNSITVTGSYISGQYNSITDQHYYYKDSLNKIYNFGQRTTKPQNFYNNAGIELDWKHSFPQKGRTLSFTSGYNRNWVSNAAEWKTTLYKADSSSQNGFPEINKITGQTVGNQVIAQLDYTHPVNDSTKWEAGIRSFTYLRDQQYFFNKLNSTGDRYILQPTYSQNALITESVNAIYFLYTRKLKNNFSIQAGLRLEQSSLKGQSRLDSTAPSFGYNYPSSDGGNLIKTFFPSFAISKKINEASEIGFNISRKIGRPGWRQMFVGIQSSDRQNITVGNPALQPEFVNTAELNYNTSWWKTQWLSSIYYILEDNTIKPYVYTSDSISIFKTTFTNVRADVRAGLDNTLTFSLGKNFSLLANFNLFNITLQTDSTKRTLWTYNAKLNITYRFPANFSAQLSTSNDSRFPQLQGYRGAIRAADFALRKSFWNNKASIVFTINDIFNSRRQYQYYDQPSAFQETMSRREVRFYKITLQLPLNRGESARKKKDVKMTRPDVDF